LIIKIDHLNKIYDTGVVKVNALVDINLNIERNEYVAVMGASGSGKSTLMNILGCLDRPTSGKYILDGSDVSSLSGNQLAAIRNKKIGFVFQAFNLLPRLTILQNVELPMVYSGVPAGERHNRALAALEKVGLSERVKHKPNEISGGQKQRVAIARSLVNNPSIILADEPTGNLDSRSSYEIMNIFEALNNEGVTIVLVTHEPDIAAFTKRNILFKDGQIIKDAIVENRSSAGGAV
jgi:putative ABC transport system ATP-binding protein